jgi:hypothetical protein
MRLYLAHMRYTLIVLGICVAAIALGAVLYAYGPSELREMPVPEGAEATALSAESSEEVAFSMLAEGEYAPGVSERKNYAAYTQEDFARLWEMAYGEEAPALPSVDFNEEYVIGVFAGERPTGGHSISVARVVDENTIRTVHIRIEAPGEGCVTTQAITSPYELVTVPFSEREHAREYTEVAVSCE